jgi:hypothetical protein
MIRNSYLDWIPYHKLEGEDTLYVFDSDSDFNAWNTIRYEDICNNKSYAIEEVSEDIMNKHILADKLRK